ncbi:uncharacterized protein BDW70DRAFT_147336 [Aspergillus foveolatus]|uniref:uncharacterized protein n=1 Tax=Aspergillus foveolatus TaxID=210207 RepID=UPI003CCDEE49
MTSLARDDYTFAWICALPLEMAAARVMLDKIHSPLPKSSADPNAYEVEEMNSHYIVIACLPAGVYGTVSAATVVSRMRGVPGKNNDIRLGDVVVSKPVGKYSGVIQYDYGKAVQGGILEPTGTLNKPPHAFLTHMGQLEAKQMIEGKAALSKIVREALEKNPEMTERFAAPETPYVMKDSETRDQAAGLMDELPTLKQWQGYAALTAAAYAKLLLSIMPVCRTCRTGSNASERNILRHWMVSLERNPRFRLLTAPDGPKRVAITALEVAHRIRNQDRECSVFWTFMNIAHILGLHEVKPAEVKEQWLLILDNADDAEMWLTTTPALEEILPQSEQGRILFNTRNGELAVELTSPNVIQIPDVDKKTAHDILNRLVLQKDLLQDPVITTSFLEQLAYFPLAIAQASAYINKKRLKERDAVELLSEDYKDSGRYNDIQNPQIQRQNQLAADYLSFMACLDPRNIPSSLLPNQLSDKKKLDALGLLKAYSFTQCQGTQISMHRLVRIATRNWLRKNGLLSPWIQRVADQLGKLFPDSSHYNRGLWREYLPHALVLVHENEFILQLEQYMELVENVSGCLTSDGRYSEAEILLLGAEHPDTLRSMHNLAYTYNSICKNTEASELMAQCATLRAKNIGATHSETLSSSDALTEWQKLDRHESLRPGKGRRLQALKRVLGFK